MTIWHLHLLNARNALTGVMSEIRAIAREAVDLAGSQADLPRFDLLVRAAGERVPPDWGIAAQTPAPGLIEVTLSPERLAPEHLRRVLVHEMHHLLRWEGPGYGASLGEALVSEGLAGHFVLRVLGGTPDPWDAARPAAGSLRQAANLWARQDVDLDEWFRGRGRMRKWTGYGIGHRLVAEHLLHDPEEDAVILARMPADTFRPALRRLLAAEGVEEPDPEGEGMPEGALPDDTLSGDGSEDEIASRDAGGPAPRTPRDI